MSTQKADSSREDSKFPQIIFKVALHKNTKMNPKYQGYALEVFGDFKITRKRIDFVRECFIN